MAEMKNICGKIPVELHEKVRAEIEERETSTQIFIRQVIEEHFNRLENKGEESMEKRTLAVQVTEVNYSRESNGQSQRKASNRKILSSASSKKRWKR